MKISARRLITALAALCLGLGAALGLFAGPAQAAGSATTEQTFLTFYGWWDNTPPGGDISYPQIHQTAGGTGTYSDPITFATDSSEQPPGTIVYVPASRSTSSWRTAATSAPRTGPATAPTAVPTCGTSTCGSAARAATPSRRSSARTR
ncbi:hypothetical protein ACFQ9X_34865 [Catenulispora yoronensis]